MPIISITNQKGGVAKTTTAIHLAQALAKRKSDYNILLIDLDSQQNATSVLLADVDQDASATSFDLFSGNTLQSRHLHQTKYDNFFLIPASLRLVEVETLLAGNLDGFFRLKETIEKAKNEFTYIILDCPPSLSMITINALVAADFVLIPIQVSKFSIDGIHRIIESVSTVKKRYNSHLEILGAVFAMHNERTNLSKVMRAQVEKFMKIFDSAIPRSIVIEEAHLMKQSLFEYAPKSRPAREYEKLAEEVLHATG